jgi:hypothetical protein
MAAPLGVLGTGSSAPRAPGVARAWQQRECFLKPVSFDGDACGPAEGHEGIPRA